MEWHGEQSKLAKCASRCIMMHPDSMCFGKSSEVTEVTIVTLLTASGVPFHYIDLPKNTAKCYDTAKSYTFASEKGGVSLKENPHSS